MRYFLACGLLAVLALVSAGTAGAQSGELPGQWLLSISSNGDTYDFDIDCRPGETSTIDFSVTGDAIVIWGGYDGTFAEEGTVTIGPGGAVTGFSSTFTITADDGTVITGTKELDTRETAGFPTGGCAGPDDASGSCSAYTSPIDLTYTATTPSGTETGTARTLGVDAFQEVCGGATHGAFEEEFLATDEPPSAPTTLTLEPATAVNEVDEAHTVTATLLDQYGAPVPDYAIQFTVTGAVTAGGSCITDVLGQCTYTFAGASFPGVAAITACSDAYGDGACEEDSARGTATKEFVLPASTAGATTGGGRVGTATVTASARSQGSSVEGTCNVVTATATVKCLDVIAYVQTGSTSVFFGRATVNGVETTYRIRIVDAADSGSERDIFSLVTASGFTLTGPLTEGNFQVR